MTLAELLDAMHGIPDESVEARAEAARLLGSRLTEPERRLRLVGRSRKVSVSMPEDLAAAVQERVGHGEFSQYVTEAVAARLENDLLGELATLLNAEHGPVSDEALGEARRSWPLGQ